MAVQIIDPISYAGWDDMLLKTPGASFFHSSHWTRVLNQSYGYKPLYFSEIKGNRLITLIPVMEVRSVLTGRRGVSLPFTDYCDLIINGDGSFQEAMDQVIEHGKKARWKSIEMRCGDALSQDISLSSFYYGHILYLSESEEGLFRKFRKGTKSSANRAIREGVKATVCCSWKAMEEFYRLQCITRKEHGLPPQPFSFFKNIYENIISQHRGIVVLASYNETIIAGAVYFHFNGSAIYKYAASNKAYQKVSANNLIMWEAIKWYSRSEYKSLYFGRTEPENKGLLQFKSGWGAKEYKISYFKYDLKRNSYVKDRSNLRGLHNKVFEKMPIPFLRLTGSLLYKHVG